MTDLCNPSLFRRATTTLAVGVLAIFCAVPAQAAEFYSGNNLILGDDSHPTDAYVAGNQVTLDTPTTGDLVVAGSNVTINKQVEKNLLAAGGYLVLHGDVGDTARMTGGTVTITSKIGHDLVVAGGDVTITKDAAIGGDLVVMGGTVTIDGPVQGDINANHGRVTINSKVGGGIDGQVTQLALGEHADIGGNLQYHAPTEAQINPHAIVRGSTNFDQVLTDNGRSAVGAGFFYNLVTSLLTTLALTYLLRRTTLATIQHLQTTPFRSFLLGLAALIVTPILLFFILILVFWLGLMATLLYALLILLSYALAQVVIGWWFLRWWYGRDHQTYQLDWRAAVVGTLAMSILWLIPGLGTLALIIIWLATLGALLQHLLYVQRGEQVSNTLTAR